VLILLVTGLSFALATRSETETTILRTPGMMYQENADGTVSNLYNYKVNNKTFDDKKIHFKVIGVEAKVRVIGNETVEVKRESATQGTMFIDISPSLLKKRSSKIVVGVYADDQLIEEIKTSFLGPVN